MFNRCLWWNIVCLHTFTHIFCSKDWIIETSWETMLLRHKWFWKAEEFIIRLLRLELPFLELLLWYFHKYDCPPFSHSFGICYLESKWSKDLLCQSGLQRAAQRCSLLPSPAVPHSRQDPGKEQMCHVVPSVAPGAASTRCPLNQRLQVMHLKMRFVCFPVFVLFFTNIFLLYPVVPVSE